MKKIFAILLAAALLLTAAASFAEGEGTNIKYSKYVWSPAYKGVDDYYHARAAA